MPKKNSSYKGHTEKKMLLVMLTLTGFLLFLCVNIVSAASPVAYYKFENDLTDETGNHNLRAGGSSSFNDTYYKLGSYALNAPGDNSIPDNATSHSDFIFGTGSFTVAFWINTTDTTYTTAVLTTGDTLGSGGGHWLIAFGNSPKVGFSAGAGAVLNSTSDINDGEWHRIVYVREGTGNDEFRIYVDNVNEQNATLATDLSSTYAFSIGNHPVGARTSGLDSSSQLDDLLIFKGYAWTVLDVENDWNGGAGQEWVTVKTSVNLITPLNNTVISSVGTNFTANYTTDKIYNFTNATYYVWNSTGGIFNDTVSVEIKGIANSTTEYIDKFTLGTYTWNVFVCWENLTYSNCSFVASNYTLLAGASINAESYNNLTYETARETFTSNISLIPGASLYDAQINYNGTNYEGTITDLGGNSYLINAALDVSLISETSVSHDWYWKLTYQRPDKTFTYQNLTTHSQNVSQINLYTTDCTAGSNLSLNFSSYNEGDLSAIADFSFDATFEYWLGSGNVRKNISVSNSGVTNNMLFCISPNNLTYHSDAKIQYEKTGFIKRSHYLINSSLTNTTNGIGLYLLNSSASTSFIISIIDNVQFPIPNAYVYIQRYYPGTGEFHTVEMARTDNSGNTIGHFEAETEDYKIIVFKDGAILYESEMHKVFCGETPCTLSFQVQAAAPTTWSNIGDLPNLIWTLTYDETTKFWTYTYVDTSGTTNFGRLLVYMEGGKERTIICNKTDTSSAATLNCNVTDYDGTIYAEAYINRSPEILVWLTSIVKRAVKAVFGMEGLFWATLILLTIGLIGLWNPSIGVAMMIVGVIMINFLQIASLGTTTIMGITIIGVLLLWGMKKP